MSVHTSSHHDTYHEANWCNHAPGGAKKRTRREPEHHLDVISVATVTCQNAQCYTARALYGQYLFAQTDICMYVLVYLS